MTSSFVNAVSSQIVIKHVLKASDLEAVLDLESRIFVECNYVSMDLYEKYMPQSVFFGAFDGDTCVGMVRLIMPGEHLPPILSYGVEITEGREQWLEAAAAGTFWEYATMVVAPDHRASSTFLSLVRAVYRFAHENGAKYFGAIMDPKRAKGQNKVYQLCYRQVGPLQYYMGEPELNAPYVGSFDELDTQTRRENPEYLDWLLFDEPTEVRLRPHPKPRKSNELIIDLRDPKSAA